MGGRRGLRWQWEGLCSVLLGEEEGVYRLSSLHFDSFGGFIVVRVSTTCCSLSWLSFRAKS